MHAASYDSGTPLLPELKPAQQQAQAARLSALLLNRYHYKAKPLDDALSEKIFDGYLKSLDSDKLFFVQADIDQLAGVRSRLDDAILNENLGIPFAIFHPVSYTHLDSRCPSVFRVTGFRQWRYCAL